MGCGPELRASNSVGFGLAPASSDLGSILVDFLLGGGSASASVTSRASNFLRIGADSTCRCLTAFCEVVQKVGFGVWWYCICTEQQVRWAACW